MQPNTYDYVGDDAGSWIFRMATICLQRHQSKWIKVIGPYVRFCVQFLIYLCLSSHLWLSLWFRTLN